MTALLLTLALELFVRLVCLLFSIDAEGITDALFEMVEVHG